MRPSRAVLMVLALVGGLVGLSLLSGGHHKGPIIGKVVERKYTPAVFRLTVVDQYGDTRHLKVNKQTYDRFHDGDYYSEGGR